jgi:hypothetical protein
MGSNRTESAFQGGLWMARVRARQSEVLSRVVDESLARMREARERREEQIEARRRERDRLRAIEERERADAGAAARRHETRRAYFEDLAGSGGDLAGVYADREARAAAARRAESRASLDLTI